MFLADAAPTGTGLAIVGVILLAVLAAFVLTVVIVVRTLVRKARSDNA